MPIVQLMWAQWLRPAVTNACSFHLGILSLGLRDLTGFCFFVLADRAHRQPGLLDTAGFCSVVLADRAHRQPGLLDTARFCSLVLADRAHRQPGLLDMAGVSSFVLADQVNRTDLADRTAWPSERAG